MQEVLGTVTEVEPVAGGIFTIVKKGISYYEKKRNDRINEFYMELYKGTASKERIEYEQQIKANEDDYYSLLSASIEDEEKEKVTIYINLFKSIRDNKIDKNIKIKYIKITKNLPLSSFTLLKEIYINQKYKMNEDEFKEYFKNIDKSEDYLYDVKMCERFGLFKYHLGMGAGLSYSNLLFDLVENCFEVDELSIS